MANKYELRRRALKDSGGRAESGPGAMRRGKREENASAQDFAPPPTMDRKGLTAGLCVGLVVLITALYVQTCSHEFTVCDDNVYIYDNPHIKTGLSLDSIEWAFKDAHEGNWHPLTWISHMCDWQMFGGKYWEPENQIYTWSRPGGHHLVGMLLHAANAVLLFLALRLLTGTLWPCFVVAVLFAAHPLRAESVAWAAERKDVLCGLFWMASLVTYGLYVRRPPLPQSPSQGLLKTVALYVLLNVFMGLGLMAKSMIVTLPAVLILLDIWPLNRWQRALWPPGREGEPADLFGGFWLLLEKVPLFALAAGDSYVTVYGQAKGVALNSFEGLPLSVRLLNAVESCGEYLRQLFWPTGLAPFYAHPHMIPNGWTHEFWTKFWIYLILLVTISFVAAWFIKRRPYLAVGWLWFLGALMPVIGIIQVGTQARADRYTYLPMIGVYIMVAWLLKEVAERWPRAKPALAVGGAIALAGLSAAAFLQVSYWATSYKLFFHSICMPESAYFGYDNRGNVDLEKAKSVANIENNYFAFNHIGIAYDKDGKEHARFDLKRAQSDFDHSAAAFAASLGIKPDYDFGNNNLGVYFARPGNSYDPVRAEQFFRKAIQVNGKYADAFNNLGIVLAAQGEALARQGKHAEALLKYADAEQQHRAGLSVRIDRASDHNNLCRVYYNASESHKALAEKAESANDSVAAANARKMQNGALNAALQECDFALQQCDPNFVGAWQTRADILREQKKTKEMLECYQRIIKIDPKANEAILALAALLKYYEDEKPPETEKAIQFLDEAGQRYKQDIQGKPFSVEFVRMPYSLVLQYMKLKQPEKAILWLDETGELFKHAANGPENAPQWFDIATLYVKLKQPGKAIMWLDQVLQVGKMFTEGYATRGVAYEMAGDTARAQADFNRVLELIGKEPLPIWVRVANKYVDLDQPAKGAALLTQFIEAHGPVAEAFAVRGIAYEKAGDEKNAKADYQRVLDAAAHASADDRFALAFQGYMALQQYDNAIELFSLLLAADPTYTPAYAARGIAYEAKGDEKNAKADFEHAVEVLSKAGLDSWITLASRYMEMPQPDKAIMLLDRCLQDGSHATTDAARMQVYAVRGVAYERKGDAQNGRADYNRVLELSANCPVIDRVKVAGSYVNLQQPDKAIVLLNQVLAADSAPVDAYVLRVKANQMKGDLPDVLADLDRLAQLGAQIPGLEQERQQVRAQLEKMKTQK